MLLFAFSLDEEQEGGVKEDMVQFLRYRISKVTTKYMSFPSC